MSYEQEHKENEVGVSQTLNTREEGVRDRPETPPFGFPFLSKKHPWNGRQRKRTKTPEKAPVATKIRLQKVLTPTPPQQRMFKELGSGRPLIDLS